MPMEVKVGDKVLYGKYSGTEVTIDGEQYLILRESDVLAVVVSAISCRHRGARAHVMHRLLRTLPNIIQYRKHLWLARNCISIPMRARRSSAASISSPRR